MRAFDSGSKPSGTMFPGHPFFSRTPRVQKPNTAYPKNRCESVLFLEMLTKLIHLINNYFSAKGFFMGPCGVWFLHPWGPGQKVMPREHGPGWFRS